MEESFPQTLTRALFNPQYGSSNIVFPVIFCGMWVGIIIATLGLLCSLLSGVALA